MCGFRYAAEVLTSPELLAAARAESDGARGPDFRYQALIGGLPPKLDYRGNRGE
jgi:aminobenzoyl-glutamate utilization protein B